MTLLCVAFQWAWFSSRLIMIPFYLIMIFNAILTYNCIVFKKKIAIYSQIRNWLQIQYLLIKKKILKQLKKQYTIMTNHTNHDNLFVM